MIKKISAAAACAACFAALTATASAATNNPVGRAANGAINAGEDLINGVAHAGEDIVNGVTGGRTNDNTTNGTTNGTNGTTNGVNNGTNNPTVSDIPDINDTDNANSGLGTTNDIANNQMPATGVSFGLTAAAAVLGALGVVVTANRRGE
ncbi:MAG: hypothetical protein ACI4JZ_01050 [Oscillospiraceae bacterium]